MAPTPPPADPPAAPLITATVLCDAGRSIPLPVRIRLADGELLLRRALRVLPGRRLVAESRLRGRPVLAKLFLGPGSRRYRDREHAGITAMQAAGIPTPGLIEVGDLDGAGHYLLTEFLVDAVSLAELQAAGQSPDPRLPEAARLLAQLHEAGLEQTDLHLGNLLVHGRVLYLIDGDGIRIRRRPLAGWRARRNLAQLLALLADPSAAQPLIDSYRAQHRNFRPSDAAVLATTARTRTRRLDEQLRKCFRDCTRFQRQRYGGRSVISLRTESGRLAPLLANPAAYLAANRNHIVTESTSRILLRERNNTLVIERFPGRRGLARLVWWRRSTAAYAWREANRDWLLGRSTRLPLALLEEPCGQPLGGWVILQDSG